MASQGSQYRQKYQRPSGRRFLRPDLPRLDKKLIMDKQQVEQYINSLASQKILTREELLNAYDAGLGSSGDMVLVKKIGAAEILYYIGGAIVFLGIEILVWQNWSTLDFFTRVLATLGASIAAYVVGILFSRDKKFEGVGSAFYLISALVLPMGLYVVFSNMNLDMGSALVASLISGICLGAFLLSYVAFRKDIFTLFSILFGTWFFFAFTNYLVGNNPLFDWHFYAYRILLIGLSYVLIGHAFAKGVRVSMSGFLYGFGILGLLGAAFSLGGYSPNQDYFWELIFPILVLGTLFVSVNLKSKSFLTFGTLFLMFYILKITGEYFTSGLGWPVSLVLAGLLLIAVGYLYVYLKKKYIPV